LQSPAMFLIRFIIRQDGWLRDREVTHVF